MSLYTHNHFTAMNFNAKKLANIRERRTLADTDYWS